MDFVFADTFYFLALLNERDTAHKKFPWWIDRKLGGYSACDTTWPSAVIIIFSADPLTEFCTSSARTFAVNETQISIAQLSAKKKGFTSVLRTF
jgi:hypothetical protein